MTSFLISNENAKGLGFVMFSQTHLVSFCLLALISYLLIIFYRSLSALTKTRMRLG
ncbi:hypothetical protein RT41_GL000679 [Lactococcus fujiensis JCM 16395]|uniref:Uncharacterized protein n=1 Tax=Lactococcus fujiensis JCM 16395 TaxID=1291764 RepID=A0A2A5RNF7_9LACT|nr:hypothetical protein RT41_GL000679 [Lactococcus fujiensis JCM 16395]